MIERARPTISSGRVADRNGWDRLRALFLGGNKVTLPVYMWTQVRFPQTLPTILALGTCIFLGSVLLIGTAEWLRRMGTQATNSNA